MHARRGAFPGRATALLKAAMVVGAVLGANACEDLLQVDLPGRLPADRLNDPAMVPVLEVGMLADFECAFQSYAYTGSVLTVEFENTITARAELLWFNRVESLNDVSGTLNCTATGGAYLPLHTARFQAEDLYSLVEELPDGSVANEAEVLGTAAAYAAYSTALLGEGFCEMVMDGGPIITREETFQRADEWFTKALNQTTSTSIRNMALVGRARTRLNLGDETGAFADASQVPEGFTRTLLPSTTTERRVNRMWAQTHRDWEAGVAPAYRDLTVEGVADTRVQSVLSTHLGQDNVSPLWLQQKYTTAQAPVVIASWKEAQLIIAETQGGQEAVDAINLLRGSAGLPSFTSTDEAVIQAQVVEERRRELWLEGHRLGDMLRLNIPFPSGVTNKGEPYGPITCIPLPTTEINVNPNAR
jgi:hypothetical protein